MLLLVFEFRIIASEVDIVLRKKCNESVRKAFIHNANTSYSNILFATNV